jgi:polyisoprenoid-binding protein YceI
MRIVGTRSFAIGSLGILCLALFLSAAAAPPRQTVAPAAIPTPEIVLTLDPAQSKVHFMVDSTLHMVHGSFALKNGTVHFDPETGKASGEIVVYTTSGDSGNDKRDARMHKEILETVKYPDAVFRPTQIDGKVAPAGSSDVKLRGVFSIHGSDHEIVAAVHAELAGEHWKGTGKFEVPYVSWGIKDPSNFLLKVKHEVSVELEMAGDVKSTR